MLKNYFFIYSFFFTLTLNIALPIILNATTFWQVREVLLDHNLPEQPNLEILNEINLYKSGALPFYTPKLDAQLSKDAQRTLDEQNDYYARVEKRIHSNGICFTGTWRVINKNSPYTGYFASGQKGLFIGRVSTTTDKTKKGQSRTFGFAGKIFPTMIPIFPVKTANFFTVDFFLGSKTEGFMESTLSNQPQKYKSLFEIDYDFMISALKVNNIFEAIDVQPTYRPVTNIAELDKPANQTAKAPKFLTIKPDTSTYSSAHKVDFREELDLKNHPDGLRLFVLVGDQPEQNIPLAEIHLTESVVSYGCDRQLHFAHPKITK